MNTIMSRWVFAWAFALIAFVGLSGTVMAQYPSVQRIIVPGTVTSASSVVVGFGIAEAGSAQKNRYLIRAYGVAGPRGLTDPVLSLFDKYGMIASNDDWGSSQKALIEEYSIQALVTSALQPLSAAVAVVLSPGAYTVQVGGYDNRVGDVIVEILELPNQMPELGDIISMFGPVLTDGSIFYVTASDKDGDVLDFFVDWDNDGEWDERSLKSYPSGGRFYFGKALPAGRHTIRVGVRDSRGAGTWKSITVLFEWGGKG